MDIDFLARLVELDTNSDSKSNYSECASLIGRKARNLGFHVEVHNAEAEDRKPRPNAVIELDADAKQTLLLATHYDVVGAGDGWKHQPFKLTIERGRAYGRGAADDKGGVVSALSAIETLKSKDSSKVNVKLLITCDEEIGGERGLGYLMGMKRDGRSLIDGDAAILIDAGPRVYIGSSGRAAGRIRVDDPLPELVSLLSKVVDYSEEREKVLSRLISASTKKRIQGRISVTMLDLSAGAVEYAKAGVKSNIIPGECRLKLKGEKEKLVIGKQAHAGYPHLAKNAIEQSLPLLKKVADLSDGKGRCEFVFDLRTTPEENLDSAILDFEKYVRTINPQLEFRIEERTEGYVIPETHPFAEMMKRATGEKNVYGELGGTDAQFFCRRGIPSVCFGPVSDESSIHGKDEFVKIKDLEFVSSSIVRLCEDWRNFKISRYG
ncbi:MAG: M20/M25/M40 family metallo-hydrolase [Candidatus Fermentimicrarchaeum limneticum]|uniref:M20/M25/M40 family metallo-hydrolase n=1 Tax=Fermentimicrarchaeum limneticum TaxID=2795018 RepID=A0A7D5XBB6_FERL1|nr:MAG: M20/M25/M40 family metallo-hydrolase [Candidatus Fermentimicrarchaeum limneticum]